MGIEYFFFRRGKEEEEKRRRSISRVIGCFLSTIKRENPAGAAPRQQKEKRHLDYWWHAVRLCLVVVTLCIECQQQQQHSVSANEERKKERTGCIKDVGTWRRRRRRALRPSDALYYNAHPAQ